jgi:flagellar motor switch protein FliN/FliY
MEKPFLSQEEVDALLGGNIEKSKAAENMEEIFLSLEEQDVLREIGNINAGSATTALSELLSQRVIINTPSLKFTTSEELQKSFGAPYLLVEVEYTSGIEGNNAFVLKAQDAAIIANLMMGGDGQNCSPDMDEITLSAVSEAMNQMIGFSATSMSQMFQTTIEISPPKMRLIKVENDGTQFEWDLSKKIVVIAFTLQIGDILQSEIMLIINIEVAKQQVQYLLADAAKEHSFAPQEEHIYREVTAAPIKNAQIVFEDTNVPLNNNLNLILDIPLRLSVLLGRTKRNIVDVLKLTQGSIVELERLETEPVDILVNDTLIARGEVVVVKEYFGVRITDIISTENRLRNLVQK